MDNNNKALQVLLNACDMKWHIGGRLYRFEFDDSVVSVEIIAQQLDKGWRVLSVWEDGVEIKL